MNKNKKIIKKEYLIKTFKDIMTAIISFHAIRTSH